MFVLFFPFFKEVFQFSPIRVLPGDQGIGITLGVMDKIYYSWSNGQRGSGGEDYVTAAVHNFIAPQFQGRGHGMGGWLWGF